MNKEMENTWKDTKAQCPESLERLEKAKKNFRTVGLKSKN
jgi:hypothetical protein